MGWGGASNIQDNFSPCLTHINASEDDVTLHLYRWHTSARVYINTSSRQVRKLLFPHSQISLYFQSCLMQDVLGMFLQNYNVFSVIQFLSLL
jgi:hypothetical protein